MNKWGPDGCSEHMETILGWLEQEAKKRNLPFVKSAAKVMVTLAIRRSRKKMAQALAEELAQVENNSISG